MAAAITLDGIVVWQGTNFFSFKPSCQAEADYYSKVYCCKMLDRVHKITSYLTNHLREETWPNRASNRSGSQVKLVIEKYVEEVTFNYAKDLVPCVEEWTLWAPHYVSGCGSIVQQDKPYEINIASLGSDILEADTVRQIRTILGVANLGVEDPLELASIWALTPWSFFPWKMEPGFC